MNTYDQTRIDKIAGQLAKKFGAAPEWAVVLGSGLGGFVDAMQSPFAVPYKTVKGLPVSAVSGHAGQFVVGTIAGKKVVAMQGRVHIYEGYSAFETAMTAAALGEIGVKKIVLTNAAGSANLDFKAGSIMAIRDHINLLGDSPLTGAPGSEKFVDMSAVYDKEILEYLKSKEGVGSGIYAAMRGPQYETPAEVQYAKKFGADAVGMSTVPEAIMARYYGLKIAGVSMISNMASGITGQPLSHAEVLEAGRTSGEAVKNVLLKIVEAF